MFVELESKRKDKDNGAAEGNIKEVELPSGGHSYHDSESLCLSDASHQVSAQSD